MGTQYDGAQITVLAQLLKGFSQLGNDVIVEGIAHIGSVEPHLSHPFGGAADVQCFLGSGHEQNFL